MQRGGGVCVDTSACSSLSELQELMLMLVSWDSITSSIFDIECILDIENSLDLEGKNSDIYHVINCISHFFWIMYIVCYGKLLIDVQINICHIQSCSSI